LHAIPYTLSKTQAPQTGQIINLSTRFFSSRICGVKSLLSFVVMLAAITDRLTPHARPRAVLLLTYTHGISNNVHKYVPISGIEHTLT